MVIWVFLFAGAATVGVLIASLVIAERELKENRRRLEALESKSAAALGSGSNDEGEKKRIPEVEREMADLREENSRLLAQTAALRGAQDVNQGKIQSLESAQERIPEVEREMADLREENSRLLAQTAELKSLMFEKIESQLAGLNELHQQVENSGKS